MGRTEFLETLRSQLSGQMQEGKAAAHVRYYEDYIQSQVRGGRSEEEVLLQLGDPRLIAKTLLDTDVDAGQETQEDYQGYSSTEGSQGSQGSHVDRRSRSRKLDLSTWYGKVAVIAAAVVLMIVLVTVIGAILPFFLVLGVVLFIFSRFRKR